MKRRNFLKYCAGGGATTAVSGLTGCIIDPDLINEDPVTVPGDTSPTSGPPYDVEAHQPAYVYSSNGVFDLELSTEFATVNVGGLPINYRTYNGKFPPDTWVVKPGDLMRIKLVNNFPASDEDHYHPADINLPHGFNNTNLHVHGLNVSPMANQDNILLDIVPNDANTSAANYSSHGSYSQLDIAPSAWTAENVEGLADDVMTSFDFATQIPTDHPSGTFWYHPHKHGSALHQMGSGMAGFLIIEGGEGDLNDVPEIGAAKTIDLAFHELIVGFDQNGMGTMPATGNGTTDDTVETLEARSPIASMFKFEAFMQYTINGLAVNEGENADTCAGAQAPFLKMRPGEVQRWRLGLLCHLQTYKFVLEGHEMHVASWDGITDLEMETYDDTDHILQISPGNRTDIIVKASMTPGTYAFKMIDVPFGQFPLFVTPGFCATGQRPEQTVFNVIVEGEPMNMALPSTINPPENRLPFIPEAEISRRRKIEFKITGNVEFNADFTAFQRDSRQYYINDLKFSAGRINQTVLLNTAEEWELTNLHEAHNDGLMINHPFHIHVNWFLVMEIWHPKEEYTANFGRPDLNDPSQFHIEYPNNGRGRWMDNIDIPFGGKAVIRHRFQKFTGTFPFHCHVIAHEDEGMMQLVECLDSTPVTSTITVGAGGTVKSSDISKDGTTNRLTATFPANAVTMDTHVSYAPTLDMAHDALSSMVGLDRYFRMYSGTGEQEMFNEEVTVVINVPAELGEGDTYDAASVQLYRSDGASWTTDGITKVSFENNTLTCTINSIENEHFAVMANLTGNVRTSGALSYSH